MDLISKRSNWASSRVSALSLLLAFPPLASVDLGSSEADSSRKWATGQHLKTDTSGKLSSQKETSLQTTIVQGICSFSKEHIADLRANECHLCQLKGGPVFGILLQSNSEVLKYLDSSRIKRQFKVKTTSATTFSLSATLTKQPMCMLHSLHSSRVAPMTTKLTKLTETSEVVKYS